MNSDFVLQQKILERRIFDENILKNALSRIKNVQEKLKNEVFLVPLKLRRFLNAKHEIFWTASLSIQANGLSIQ